MRFFCDEALCACVLQESLGNVAGEDDKKIVLLWERFPSTIDHGKNLKGKKDTFVALK